MDIVSLYASAGGMDYGLLLAGYTPIKAYEIDTHACETYERVTGCAIEQADLTRIDLCSIPDSDMIIGGPPCQEFSEANSLGSVDGDKNLWPATIKIIQAKRPTFFLFENVTGLTTRHAAYFNWIVVQFKALGYRVETRILNAADFGVPQTRKRVFIAGRLDDRAWSWPTPTHTETGDMFSQKWVSWHDVLPTGWQESAATKDMPEWVLNRPSYQPLPQNALFNVKDAFKDILHRPANKPAFTVTGECIQRSRVVLDGIVYAADSLLMARIQTFPDIEMHQKHIGNAVPPLLAKAVFSAMETAS